MSLQPATVALIERIALRSALGVRFHDAHSGQSVSSGLSVLVVLDRSGRTVPAVRTPSGAYTVASLPGLSRWERRSVNMAGGEDDSPAAGPVTIRIEVRDLLGRYLPFQITTTVPAEPQVVGSPPTLAPGWEDGVPLFSAPARPVPSGTAVVRASLLRAADGQPAAHACLDVLPRVGAGYVRGIADHRGEVAVLFPYPAPARALASPPGVSRQALAASTWKVALLAGLPLREPGRLPELDRLLDQSPANLSTAASPPDAITHAELIYGRECIVASAPLLVELVGT